MITLNGTQELKVGKVCTKISQFHKNRPFCYLRFHYVSHLSSSDRPVKLSTSAHIKTHLLSCSCRLLIARVLDYNTFPPTCSRKQSNSFALNTVINPRRLWNRDSSAGAYSDILWSRYAERTERHYVILTVTGKVCGESIWHKWDLKSGLKALTSACFR